MEYKTIARRCEARFIEKKSEFIGYLCPVRTEEEAVAFIEEIRAMHRKATHNCYAYILRENNAARHSDDGEPGGTAGVNQLLLTGEERMALRADFYSDVLLGRACRDLVTASASDYSSFVYGMNTFFHEFHLNPYMPNPGLLTISGSDLGIVITIIYSITTF